MSDLEEAYEHLAMFTDSGFYTLPNDQVRAICAAIREVKELRSQLVKQSWQPIETAPKDKSCVLIAGKNR